MTSRQAEYIIAMYREGSVTKAASKLNVSQPALSQCIRVAEKDIGAEIFVKNKSPLTLTYAGEKYYEIALEMLRLEENLHLEIKDLHQEQAGKLSFGISMLRGATYLPSILNRYEATHPKVNVKISEIGSHACFSAVQNGDVDLGILSVDKVSQKVLAMEPLCKDKVYIMAGPKSHLANRYKSGTEVSASVLQSTPVVEIKEGHGLYQIQVRIFSTLANPPIIKYEIESVVLGTKLVEATDALMLCPYSVLGTLMTKNLSVYPLKESIFSNTVCIGYRHDKYIPRYMREFIDIVKEEISEEKIPVVN